jgi:hypothetical protein
MTLVSFFRALFSKEPTSGEKHPHDGRKQAGANLHQAKEAHSTPLGTDDETGVPATSKVIPLDKNMMNKKPKNH